MLQKFTWCFAIISFVSFYACSDSNSNTPPSNNTSSLVEYLKANADFVHEINGFYIVGSAQKPGSPETTPGTTGKEIFDHSVRLFSNFLDQDNDGVIDADKKQLNKDLAAKLLFISGPLTMVDKISESTQVNAKGLYGMSMQTNHWPYIKDYNGKGWTVSKLESSTWRPPNFNALWEETFHTITEAYSRTDQSFRFTTGGALRTHMDKDIQAKTYDISEQNAAENGNYDKVTAVNEYIHQIWAIAYAGQEVALNPHQKAALAFMKTKNVPMKLVPNYAHKIGKTIK
ncbi:exported hypothetical protein [Tenacibaculum litopenaei]|uniref:hypothetical protein n=1 Tax=Tenacibaculum litopenaei TaxID=396016 RepID=UPI00389390E0